MRPFAASLADAEAKLEASGALLCGDTAALPSWRGPALHQGWTPPEGLAQIAARRLQNGDTDDFLSLVPLYVVAPSISTPKSLPTIAPKAAP